MTEVPGGVAWGELDGQTLQAEKAEGRGPEAESKLGCQGLREERQNETVG